MTQALRAGGALTILAGLLYSYAYTADPHPTRWLFLWGAVFGFALFCRVRFDALTGWVLAFVGYAALSLLWSPDWRQGLMSFNILALLSFLFIALRQTSHDWLQWAVPWGAAVCIAVSAMQPDVTYGGMRNENFHAEFLCLLIPLALIGWRTIPIMAAGLAIWILWLNLSDAKWMGLAGALGFGLLYLWRRGYRAPLLCAPVIAGAALWLIWPAVRLAVLRRVELSYDTLLMWLDRPVFGIGIGGFDYLYPFYQERHPNLIDGNTINQVHIYAGATHNEYVQALAIFGMAGFAILCAIAWHCRKTQNTHAFVAVSVMAGLASVNFPMQNPSTAILGVIALALSVGPVAGVSRLAERQGGAGRTALQAG